MTPKTPLLTLVLGNLDDALELGLIDDTSGEASTFRADIESGWTSTKDQSKQLEHFKVVMATARSRLDVLYRPVRNARRRVRTVATVMSFERFAKRFEDEIAAPKDSDVLKSLLDVPASASSDLDDAAAACLVFTSRFGSTITTATGRRIRASSVGIGAGRHTWIASPPLGPVNSGAQYWRDRLGLIHVQTQTTPFVKHALVPLCFSF